MGKSRRHRNLKKHDGEFNRAKKGKVKADEAGKKWTMGSQYGHHRDVDQKSKHKGMQDELKTLGAFAQESQMPLTKVKRLESDGANEDFMAMMPESLKKKNDDIQSKVVPAMTAGYGADKVGETKNEVKRAEIGGTNYFDKAATSDGLAGDEAGRELYLPLMSHALGLDTLALAGRGKDEEGQSRIVTEGAAGKSIGQRLTDATEGDLEALNKVSGDDVLKTMMSQMLFQDKDGHSEQYLVDDEGGLVKIDQGDMGLDDNSSDFTGTTEQLAASSFMAAMPSAFDEISDEMYDMVADWDPEEFKLMQENAGLWGGSTDQEKENGEKSIARQTENMEILKQIMQANRGRLTANELFKKFNTEKLNRAERKKASEQGGQHQDFEEHPMFENYKDTQLRGQDDPEKKAYDHESETYENMGRFGTEQVWQGDAWHDSMQPRKAGYSALDDLAETRKGKTEANRDIDDKIAHEQKKWDKKAGSRLATKRRKKKLERKYGGRISALEARRQA